jgi:hypothetical protein
MADDCSSNNVQSESGVKHEEEEGGVKIGIVKTLYEELEEMNLAKELAVGSNVSSTGKAHMHDKASTHAKDAKLKFKFKKENQPHEAEAKVKACGISRVRILKRGELIDEVAKEMENGK